MIEKYLGVDVDACFRLFNIQKLQLKSEQMEDHFYNIKMHTVRNVTKIEYAGFRSDKKLLLKISKKIAKKQKIDDKTIIQLAKLGKLEEKSRFGSKRANSTRIQDINSIRNDPILQQNEKNLPKKKKIKYLLIQLFP